ncbi:MAG: hypothetical protein QXN55_01330, partial [Candidatus Nitrosotenuis sp.]
NAEKIALYVTVYTESSDMEEDAEIDLLRADICRDIKSTAGTTVSISVKELKVANELAVDGINVFYQVYLQLNDIMKYQYLGMTDFITLKRKKFYCINLNILKGLVERMVFSLE